MKKILLIIIFCQTLLAGAQHHYSIDDKQSIIDSLKNIIQTSKSDSIKCILNFRIANIYIKDKDMYFYKVYNKKANDLKKKNPYLNDVSIYYNASDYVGKNDFDTYQKKILLAYDKLKKYKNPDVYTIRAIILNNVSLFKSDKEAVKMLIDKGIPLAKRGSDKGTLAIIYKSLSIIFINNNDYNKSEHYTNLSINTLLENDKRATSHFELLIENYLNLAEIFIYKNEQDKALSFLKKAYSILNPHPDSNLFLPYYAVTTHYHYGNKDYIRSLNDVNKGIAKAVQFNDQSFLNRYKLMKFSILKQLKRYEEAKVLLVGALQDKGIHMIDKKNYSLDLSWIYKQLNDFPNALKYSEQYIKLSDSLNEIKNKSEIDKIESKYRNKENENKIKDLEIQKQKALLTVKNNRLHIVVIGLVAVIFLLTSVFLLKNSKNQKRIANQNEINYNQTLNSFKTRRELELMQALIKGEEDEKKRIARDLHDGIGSRLSALKMQLKGITSPDKYSTEYTNFSSLLSQTIVELRQIAFNLMPETLLKLGLELALKDLCYSLGTDETSITFHANDIGTNIKPADQVHIFRIVQELITNALKHSECSEIMVDCSQNDNLFLITVEDNGKGFSTSENESNNGLGLRNIRNRVELLDGKLEFNSKLNVGTVFNIELMLT